MKTYIRSWNAYALMTMYLDSSSYKGVLQLMKTTIKTWKA